MTMTNAEMSGGAAETLPLGSSRSAVSIILWSDRRRKTLQAAEGGALVWVLKGAGVPLPAVCGGKGVCGTCKISLMPEWAAKLPPPQKREQRLLAHLKAVPGERLSCQITLTAELDGIEVCAPDSPQQHENES
jgi:ferredoxin